MSQHKNICWSFAILGGACGGGYAQNVCEQNHSSITCTRVEIRDALTAFYHMYALYHIDELLYHRDVCIVS